MRPDKQHNSTEIQELASWLTTKRLQVPALFLLEAHLPLHNLLHQGTLAFAPFLEIFLSKKRLGILQSILKDRKNMEALASQLEKSRSIATDKTR